MRQNSKGATMGISFQATDFRQIWQSASPESVLSSSPANTGEYQYSPVVEEFKILPCGMTELI